MVSYRDLTAAFTNLDIDHTKPVIVHAAISSFGEVRGGVETVLGALLASFSQIMVPTFTYKTMIIPEDGPAENAIVYGSGKDLNRMAEFFTSFLPADPQMGVLPEALRKHPKAKRSMHPILSFSGIGVDEALSSQTLEEPFAPIMYLTEQRGSVLLLGVDHSVNTSLHVAEEHAGRLSFTRWALTPRGIVECPKYPGCSIGFDQAGNLLTEITSHTVVGNAIIQAVPLDPMIQQIASVIKEDPLILLCDRTDCAQCNTIRDHIKAQS